MNNLSSVIWTDKIRRFLTSAIKSFNKYLPDFPTLLLIVGLLLTALGKLDVIRTQNVPAPVGELLQALFPDVVFFGAVWLVASCLYLLKPSAFSYRCVFLLAALLAFWSVSNCVWLIKSGVQLSPGIVLLLIGDFKELWPLVRSHIRLTVVEAFAIALVTLMALAFCFWKFIRPANIVPNRVFHLRRAVVAACLLGLLFLSKPLVGWLGRFALAGDVISFSSHWNLLADVFRNGADNLHAPRHTQNIKLAGQRDILPPSLNRTDLPNVVLVLLESVSFSVTSLNDDNLKTTPCLAQLARQGAHFEQTRVVMPFTTKAFWSVLTGVSPVIKHNFVEAVPADGVYEGLPSILAKAGYRSAFFEVSRGTFNCAPGFFSNLGFDWAWFRENLEDPSAYIGYVGGDDFRLLDPAFKWVAGGTEPFFLMVITTVTHDPFLVPDWFEKPEETVFERYLQSVRFTDSFLQQLCRLLEDNKMADNTILCVIGDHGTSFVNRTKEIETRWVASEEVIRVPWVIKWPGHIEQGSVISRPCSQLDVTPTILGLIGFDISNAGFEGSDAFCPSQSQRRVFFASLQDDGPRGFVQNTTKVVYWPRVNKVLCYNIVIDPGERNPQVAPPQEIENIKLAILDWQNKTQIVISPKRFTRRLVFSHWQTFSEGESAWAYYIPGQQ